MMNGIATKRNKGNPVAFHVFPPDPAGTEFEPAGDDAMWLDPSFRGQLDEAGLADFRSVMQSTRGRCLRALDDRENWYLDYLELPSGQGPPRGAYLKKHHVRTLRSRLRALRGLTPLDSAGRVEAQFAMRLSDAGIEHMRLIAYGEKLRRDGLVESFLLTEELAGYQPLDDFLRGHFLPGGQSATDGRLDELIRRVAQVARCFHSAGFNHRDLYCCHFYVREPLPGTFDVKLIDLQRVQSRRRFRRRWLVKDLAQLAYSAPRELITCRRQVAFLRHYFGHKLRAREKRLVRAVVAKRRLMEWKLGVPE